MSGQVEPACTVCNDTGVVVCAEHDGTGAYDQACTNCNTPYPVGIGDNTPTWDYMPTTNDRIKCEECDDTVGNSKWAKIKAAQCRWLFLVNGEAYCPEHEPPWEAKWRKRSGRKARTVAQLSTMD